MLTRRELILLIIAACGLLLVSLVYYTDRPSETVYLIPQWLPVLEQPRHLFGSSANYLPAFLHPFIFILLTYACLLPSHRRLLIVCTGWFAINLLFEVAQIEPIAQSIAATLSNQLDGIPLLENITPYFGSGIYDIKDILAITAGALSAYITVLVIHKYTGAET